MISIASTLQRGASEKSANNRPITLRPNVRPESFATEWAVHVTSGLH
jgi:hypothetical protein